MKITFLRPNMSPLRSGDACEPVVFGILASLTPPDVECVLYDERLEDLPLEEPTDLVAMTVETFTAHRAYEIATHYHGRGIPVVMGGYHPTLCPDEALQYADAIVIGDAEDTWPALIEDARHGGLQRVYKARYPSLDRVRVDRTIFRGKPYRRVGLVQFGRGCRYACDFCSIHAFYGANRRWRPTANVIEEIRSLGRRHVFFCDDNLFNDRERFEELLEALARERVHWSCQISSDVTADDPLLGRMAAAGCNSLLIGFESLDAQNLRQMRKSWNRRHGSYEAVIEAVRRHGMMVYGTFVFGYDHDTIDAFDATLEFAVRNRLFLANFNPLAPTPGAALFGRLKTEGRLRHDAWWLDDGFRYGDSMFDPIGMTAEELRAGCYRARTAFNTWSNIARRFSDRRANCRGPYNATSFVLANLLSRREIHRKQGRRLGSGLALAPLHVPRAQESVAAGATVQIGVVPA